MCKSKSCKGNFPPQQHCEQPTPALTKVPLIQNLYTFLHQANMTQLAISHKLARCCIMNRFWDLLITWVIKSGADQGTWLGSASCSIGPTWPGCGVVSCATTLPIQSLAKPAPLEMPLPHRKERRGLPTAAPCIALSMTPVAEESGSAAPPPPPSARPTSGSVRLPQQPHMPTLPPSRAKALCYILADDGC